MEPGHPERHEPRTDAAPPASGTPPRPQVPAQHVPQQPVQQVRARRGWMSDSPLDGGSGWPTSAYAIVKPSKPLNQAPPSRPPAIPAQPTPIQAVPVPPPPVTGPVAEPPVQDEQPRRRGLAVAGALVFVLVVVLAVVYAMHSAGARADSDPTPGTNPVVTGTDTTAPGGTSDADVTRSENATATDPSSTAAATPSASGAQAGGGPVEPDAYRAGTVRLTAVAGQPAEAFDLDGGTKGTAGTDLSALGLGITAANGSRFAVWSRPGSPTLADCAAIPMASWGTSVPFTSVKAGTSACALTSDGRIAAVAFHPLPGAVVGTYTTDLDYTVWKKSTDS